MEEVKEYVKQCNHLTSHNQQLYAIIWGQTTESVQAKMRAWTNFLAIHNASNGIELLNKIQVVLLNMQEQRDLPLIHHQTKFNFYHLPHGHQTLEWYYQ